MVGVVSGLRAVRFFFLFFCGAQETEPPSSLLLLLMMMMMMTTCGIWDRVEGYQLNACFVFGIEFSHSSPSELFLIGNGTAPFLHQLGWGDGEGKERPFECDSQQTNSGNGLTGGERCPSTGHPICLFPSETSIFFPGNLPPTLPAPDLTHSRPTAPHSISTMAIPSPTTLHHRLLHLAISHTLPFLSTCTHLYSEWPSLPQGYNVYNFEGHVRPKPHHTTVSVSRPSSLARITCLRVEFEWL